MFNSAIGDVSVNRRKFMFITGGGLAATYLASCSVGGGTPEGAEKTLRAVIRATNCGLGPACSRYGSR